MKILTLILMLFCIFDTMAKPEKIYQAILETTLRTDIRTRLQDLQDLQDTCSSTQVQLILKEQNISFIERYNGDVYLVDDIIKLFGNIDTGIITVTSVDELFDKLDAHPDQIQPVRTVSQQKKIGSSINTSQQPMY